MSWEYICVFHELFVKFFWLKNSQNILSIFSRYNLRILQEYSDNIQENFERKSSFFFIFLLLFLFFFLFFFILLLLLLPSSVFFLRWSSSGRRPKTDHDIAGFPPFKGKIQEKEIKFNFLFLLSEYSRGILRNFWT